MAAAGTANLATGYVNILANLQGFQKSLDSAKGMLGSALKSMASIPSMILGGPAALLGSAGGLLAGGGLALGLTKTVTAAADFEQAMANAGVAFDIFDRRGNQTFEKLRGAALQAGAETKYSGAEAAAGLQQLGQAGLTAQESIDALRPTMDLAAVSGVAVSDAARIAANTMRTFGMAAADLNRVNDLLVISTGKSSADIGDLAYSLKYAGGAMTTTKTSLAEGLAVLAKFSDVGIRGEQAGTTLRSMLTDLVSPSNEAKAALKRLGISTEDLGKKEGAFLKILEQMQAANMDLATATAIFGDMRAGPMLSLLSQIDSAGQKGVASIRAMVAEMDSPAAQGITGKRARAMQDTFWGAWEQMRGAIEATMVSIGTPMLDALRPALEAVTGWFANVSRFVNDNIGTFRQWALQVKDIAYDVGSGIWSAIQTALDAVSRLLLGYEFRFNFGDFRTGMQMVLDWVERITSDWGRSWELFVVRGKIAIREIENYFRAFVTTVVELWGGLSNFLPRIFAGIRQAIISGNEETTKEFLATMDRLMKGLLHQAQNTFNAEVERLRVNDQIRNQLIEQRDALVEQQQAAVRLRNEQRQALDMLRGPGQPLHAALAAAVPGGAFGRGGQLAQALGAGAAAAPAAPGPAAKSEFKSQKLGLAAMHDALQKGVLDRVEEQQLDEQKKINDKLKDANELLKQVADGVKNMADGVAVFGR